MAKPDLEQESGPIYSDLELERELRFALKSEPEIDLFKVVNKALRVTAELANNESVKTILQSMWLTVADFYALVVECPSLANLPESDLLVIAHQDMKANFRAVAAINAVFSEASLAEAALSSQDDMQREQEDFE